MSCLHVTTERQWDHTAPDGAYFNQMHLKEANSKVAQHSHTEAHTTLLTRGSLRAWRDGELLGDFAAPAAIFIPARVKHEFMSLEADTLAFCVFARTPVMHEGHPLLQRVA